jgi:hypothetical protein
LLKAGETVAASHAREGVISNKATGSNEVPYVVSKNLNGKEHSDVNGRDQDQRPPLD